MPMRFVNLAFEVAGAMLDVNQVVAMRVAAIAMGGPAGAAEAHLMVEEKIVAAADAGRLLAAGGSPEDVVGLYRNRVRANLDRLAAGSAF